MNLSKVSEIFNIKYGVNLELSNIKKDSSGINFISRTEKNNGLSAKVRIIDDVSPNPKHTISVAGGGSVLSSFYQDKEYYSGRDLYYLKPYEKLTKNQMLYYCMCLRANKYKYSYGRQANKTLKDIKIPSIDSIPDWVNTSKIKTPNRKAVLNKQLTLDIENWQKFDYSEIFNIKKGNTPKKQNDGSVFLVSATGLNNGVSKTVASATNPNKRGLITVSSNGAVGDAFYQNQDFYATGDVNILFPNFDCNQFVAMFLITVIRQEKFRFNYGRKWGKEKMLSHKIKLPVNKNNQPDWQFMEDYIKSLPYSKSL
ncbi:hypothetical protein BAZOLSSOX_746 [uncultured Gammaproteobacteria bacterium]|nr:hypothetical protein BAZOLSSOX_746 [uncultured Gammaproteobacteria bacterium]